MTIVEDISLDDERILFVEAKPVGWAGTVGVQTLETALKQFDIPEDLWPSEPSANKCLERAVKELATDRRTLVRPLPKRKGWTVVSENAELLDLDQNDPVSVIPTAHRLELTVRVKTVNDTNYVECTPWNSPLADTVRRAFAEWTGVYKASEDLSQWFSRVIVPWCGGVATRARGGSYYILKGDNLDRMRKVQNVLANVSMTYTSTKYVGDVPIKLTNVESGGRIQLKPEVASTVAVEILLENFLDECDKVADNVNAKLEDTNLGHKALDTQAKAAQSQASKVETIENLLDVKLDEFRDRLDELGSAAGLAAMKALNDDV